MYALTYDGHKIQSPMSPAEIEEAAGRITDAVNALVQTRSGSFLVFGIEGDGGTYIHTQRPPLRPGDICIEIPWQKMTTREARVAILAELARMYWTQDAEAE